MAGRLNRMFRRRSVAATMKPDSTLSGDIERSQIASVDAGTALQPGAKTAAPVAGLMLRATTAARRTAWLPAHLLERAAARALRTQVRGDQAIAIVIVKLQRPKSRALAELAQDYERRMGAIGLLTAWIPKLAFVPVLLAMVVVDPTNVYLAIRLAMDVPDSVGFFDIRNTSVLVALGAASALTGFLLAVLHGISKALGHLLFAKAMLAEPETYPEVKKTRDMFGTSRLAIIVGTFVVGIGVATYFLHAVAEARLLNNTSALFGGSTEVAEAVVLFITALPAAVAALGTIAGAPQLEHAALAAQSALLLRLTELFRTRGDHRRNRKQHRGIRRTAKALARLVDRIQLVPLRALAEINDAEVQGQIGTSTRPEPDRVTGKPLEIDVTGSVLAPFGATQAPVSALTATAVNGALRLRAVPEDSVVAALYRAFREDPLAVDLTALAVSLREELKPAFEVRDHGQLGTVTTLDDHRKDSPSGGGPETDDESA